MLFDEEMKILYSATEKRIVDMIGEGFAKIGQKDGFDACYQAFDKAMENTIDEFKDDAEMADSLERLFAMVRMKVFKTLNKMNMEVKEEES